MIKVDAKKLDDIRLEYLMFLNDNSGSFTTHLFKAFTASDTFNFHKLARAFPEHGLAIAEARRGEFLKDFYNPGILKISTGQPSTLKTYREIAVVMSGLDENSKAVKFFDDRISQQGEDAEVIQEESQVIYLINSMLKD